MITFRRVGRRVGNRGVFLTLFGGVYILIGYSYLNIPPSSRAAIRYSLYLALKIAPLSVYAWAWIVAGAVAVWSGLFTFTSPRRPVGFTVAVVMPTIWALINFAAWVNGDSPRGWVSAAVFGLIAAAVATVAGMAEVRELR
jgi:hypothetical protein